MRYRTVMSTALLLASMLGFTPVRTSADAPPTFKSLKVGQVVSVDGRPAGARAVLARIIKIESGPDEDKVKGRIENIDAANKSFVVLGVKVFAAPEASVEDRVGRPLSLSDLKTGWVVKAKGELRADGTLGATEIKVGNPAATEAEVQGKIQALDTARHTLTVIGLTIRAMPTTRFTLE